MDVFLTAQFERDRSYRQILVTTGPVRRRRLWADGQSVGDDLDPVVECHTKNEFWQLVVSVEPSPAFLCALEQLKTIASAVLLDRQPFDRIVRWRTVAKVISMGLVVRRCFQCAAGKS